MFIYHN